MTNKPIFQKRHYEAIALMFHEFHEYGARFAGSVNWRGNAIDELAPRFAELFAKDNPNFQSERFIDAVREGRLSLSTKNAKVGPAMPYYHGNEYADGRLTRRSYKKG